MHLILFEQLFPPTGPSLTLATTLYKSLAPLVRAHPGFISEQDYSAAANPNPNPDAAPFTALTLGLFESADALVAWRRNGRHKSVQQRARARVFEGYRIRVGEVGAEEEADGGVKEGEHMTTSRPGAWVVVCRRRSSGVVPAAKSAPHAQLADIVLQQSAGKEASASASVAQPVDVSIYRSEHGTSEIEMVYISSWNTQADARAFAASVDRREGDDDDMWVVRVERDYTMGERGEAPVE
ncbi:hypothetical protein BDV95DRAFT_643502 [Massariosphaeria phaeospora]|uniref:ABM domain-containing protein n=1 Tax=Massariosphaeria phaeospora TaxID=100035 RepID=A0A7C8MWY0_9PLEO|nr:hypothetical protein BDV95DRAFT_643502 [Massariosphaeria phaeospora]